MLVLSRRRNESVIIRTPGGETIQVFVSSIVGDKVRLGFEAPKSTNIYRQEIGGRAHLVTEGERLANGGAG